MKVLSLNIAEPKEYMYEGKKILTSIFKLPVSGKVKVVNDAIVGNGQADLKHHGGNDKAVYAYPSEHYLLWQNEYPKLNFETACFGENLTTEGILEDEIFIGDIVKIGSCKLQVTQPRLPCSKFGFRMGDKSVIKHMTETKRCGFYFSIVEEGEMQASDEIQFIYRDEKKISIAMVNKYYLNKEKHVEDIKIALTVEALSKSWKEDFKRFLEK